MAAIDIDQQIAALQEEKLRREKQQQLEKDLISTPSGIMANAGKKVAESLEKLAAVTKETKDSTYQICLQILQKLAVVEDVVKDTQKRVQALEEAKTKPANPS